MMTAGSRNSSSGSASGAAPGGGGASSDCANNFFSFDEFPNQSRISSPLQNPPMTIPLSGGGGTDGDHEGHQQGNGPIPTSFHISTTARAKLERAAQYHAFHARQQLLHHHQQQQRRTPLDDVFADIPPSPLSSLLLGGGAIGSFQQHPHHAQHAAAYAAAAGRAYSHIPLAHPNDTASSTPNAPEGPTTSSLGFTNYPELPSSSSSSSSNNPLTSNQQLHHNKPSPASSTSIPLSPYTSSLLLPLDMYATTPEGQRHHIHLMDSPAMSSLLLHPHIAPSAGTLTPTPLATLPGGVCADPKLLCASGAAPAAVSASTSASSGQLPPAASAFAYQHQGTGGSAGGGYFPHAAASFYATQSMSASSSVASALSMAALDPTIMSGASSRFTSPAGAFRALSAPPMVESRVGSPIREIVEDQAQHELDSEMEQGQGDCMRAPATGPTTRRMTRRARRQEDELEDDDMEVDTPSEFHVTVKLEPDADPMDEDNGSHVDAKPTQTPAKRPVGRPRKTRGRPRRVVAEQEPEQGPETEPGVEVEVPAARSKRTKRAGAAKAKDGGLLSGLGDALLLTAAAAAKSAAASEGSVRQASDAEDHEPQEDAGMGQLHSPQPQPPAPPAPAPAAPKSKPSSKKRSRASTAPNPPTAASAARSIPDNHPTSHVAYPKASLVVGQIDLFPHPLDARVTDLRRHFKSRNSFGSGALELALSATAPNIPSPLSISMSAVAGGDDDNDQHHQDDGKPKTTAEAKALGMSKDAIRQLRNKISARNFRQRKKQYIHTLEDQVLDLKRQLAEEVKARVEVEAKLNQCERQLGVQETPTRGEWPVGWREEVGRIGMVEGEDGEDDVEDGDDDEAVGDEAAGASKKKRQRVSSAPPAGKKFPGAVAAEGATGESTGKRKGTRKSSAAQPQNASTSAAAEAEHEDSEPPVELEHTAMSRQSSTQPNQAPAAVPAANYYPHAGTAPTAMVAMPPGIYSPLQQQHLTATHAAAVAPGAYPASSSPASGTGAASGYSAQHHPFMAYQQHMHSASAQAAISHARRAAAAAVSAAMGGGPGGHQTNTHGMYQHAQGPHYHVGAARR